MATSTARPHIPLTFLTRIRTWVYAHKVWSVVIGAVIVGGGYYGYSIATAAPSVTHYVTTTVASGTVVASISETGQVSASSNVEVDAKAAGEVLQTLVAPGTHVGAGTALAYLDPTTAQKEVRDAQTALETAQLALKKLQEPPTQSNLLSTQNSVSTAQAALTSAHTTSYNDVSASFLDMPTVITSLDTILHGNTVPGRTSQQNEAAYSDMVNNYDSMVRQYMNAAESTYQTAYSSYQAALTDFKATPRDASDATIESITQETYTATANLSDALKAATDFLNFVDNALSTRMLIVPSQLPGQITTLTTDTGEINNHVSALSADTSSIASNQRALAASQASLQQLQTGADPLDIQTSQVDVQVKQNALTDAQTDLANTVVRAPFSGTVAKLNVQQYSTIANNASVATMVSDNQSVAISVNEVDAAKLKVGEKATITFEALPTLTIAGTVSSVDSIGTVTQGVVSYGAIVTFDTPNPQVKPGMSATTNIITGTEDGLVAPASAVKTIGGQPVVQIFSPPLASSSASAGGAPSATPPTNVPVAVGLSDGSNTVIEAGLTNGEQIVVSTLSGSATTKSAATQSTSVFGPGGGVRTGGGTRAGGGAVRFGG